VGEEADWNRLLESGLLKEVMEEGKSLKLRIFTDMHPVRSYQGVA
jgi:hypothetical protein